MLPDHSAAAAIAAVRLLSLQAEPRVRNPQSNLALSHPASLLPPLPGSHAAGPVPPAGRTSSPEFVMKRLRR